MAGLDGYINSLCEPGASRAYGVWTEGHVDPGEFAAAASSEAGRYIDKRDVRQGYCRVLRGVMHFTEARSRGATPVTWAEW
jgi:hypothetical protein